MRHSYPLIYCLPEEVQAKLLGQVSSIDVVPDPIWSEWKELPMVGYLKSFSLNTGVDYDKFIRRAPSRSRG